MEREWTCRLPAAGCRLFAVQDLAGAAAQPAAAHQTVALRANQLQRGPAWPAASCGTTNH